MKSFNLTAWALNHRAIVLFLILVIGALTEDEVLSMMGWAQKLSPFKLFGTRGTN